MCMVRKLALTLLHITKPHKNYLQNMQHVVLRNRPYPIYRHGKACLSKQPLWCAAGDPRLARGRSWVRAPGPAGALHALFFFSTLPSFLLREIVFLHLPHQTHESVRVNQIEKNYPFLYSFYFYVNLELPRL